MVIVRAMPRQSLRNACEICIANKARDDDQGERETSKIATRIEAILHREGIQTHRKITTIIAFATKERVRALLSEFVQSGCAVIVPAK